jgi:hypothetical protein
MTKMEKVALQIFNTQACWYNHVFLIVKILNMLLGEGSIFWEPLSI